MSQVVSTYSSLDHPCIEGLIVINAKREQKLALFTQKSYSPTNLSNIYFSPTTVNSKQKDVTGPPHSLTLGGGGGGMPRHVEMVRTKCQPKSWSGQNANHGKKVPDKMPTQVGILSGWHFVRLAFSPTTGRISRSRNMEIFRSQGLCHEQETQTDIVHRFPQVQNCTISNVTIDRCFFIFCSFGNKILYPWGHTSQKAPDWRDLKAIIIIDINVIIISINIISVVFIIVIVAVPIIITIIVIIIIITIIIFWVDRQLVRMGYRLLVRGCKGL